MCVSASFAFMFACYTRFSSFSSSLMLWQVARARSLHTIFISMIVLFALSFIHWCETLSLHMQHILSSSNCRADIQLDVANFSRAYSVNNELPRSTNAHTHTPTDTFISMAWMSINTVFDEPQLMFRLVNQVKIEHLSALTHIYRAHCVEKLVFSVT